MAKKMTKDEIVDKLMIFPKYKNWKRSKLSNMKKPMLQDLLNKVEVEIYVEVTEEEKIASLDKIFLMIKDIKLIAKNIGIDNIFYNEQYKELQISTLLKHVHNEGQGSDAIFNNENCEYKTIANENGSFQYHWLSEDKMNKLRNTPHHYFCVYDVDNIDISKIYYLPKDKIIPLLEEIAFLAKDNLVIINQSAKKTKNKNIDAHKSFSLSKIIELGAELVYSI